MSHVFRRRLEWRVVRAWIVDRVEAYDSMEAKSPDGHASTYYGFSCMVGDDHSTMSVVSPFPISRNDATATG